MSRFFQRYLISFGAALFCIFGFSFPLHSNANTEPRGVISIVGATKFDENGRIFADIYDKVKLKDNNWVTVKNNQFIRATFEQVLDKTNDVTLFASLSSRRGGEPSDEVTSVEVYPVYEDAVGNKTAGTPVATFKNIDRENTYKVLLTGLQKPTAVFDLKVIGGDVDFDYIVDPPTTYYWYGGTGSWSNYASHWSTNSGNSPSAPASNVPAVGDSVVFDANSGTGTVTIDTATISVANFNTTGSSASLAYTINSGVDFTSTGTVTIISGVTVTNNGTATIADLGAGTGTWTQGTNSTLNYAGASITPTLTATASGNTVSYNSTAVGQTTKSTTYNNLTINDSGQTATLGGNTTVNANLVISAGTVQLSTYNLTVTGTSSITGTLNDNSATGTNVFVGLVTINAGGVWTTTNNPGFTFRGGLTNDSTAGFTSGTGTYNFSTNAQTVSGSQSFTITNLTNNITAGSGLTFSGAQPTVTTLTQNSSAQLTFAGAMPTITTLTATVGGNVVNYTGTAVGQTVKSTTYNNLTFNNTGQTATLGGNTTVNGNLTITAGTLELSTYNLSVVGTSSITGTLSDNSATGTNLLVGAVTINAGGVWATTNNPGFTFRGGLTNNSTAGFTSGTGAYTFNTSAQTISGAQSFSITNITNSITTGSGLTFSGAQPTVTTLTQSNNAVLTFTGTVPTITTLTASNSGNTVTYSSTTAAQTIIPATYLTLTINNVGQTATLGGTVTVTGTLTLTAGTLDAGNQNISCANFSSANSNTRTITMGSGTWTLSGTGTIWDLSTNTNLTLNPNTSTILMADTGASDKTFAGGSRIYNNLTISGGGAGKAIITGGNTFNNLTINPPKTVNFTAATVTTILGSFSSNGTVSNGITILSATAAQHTLSKDDGAVTVTYTVISFSNATGGAGWRAYTTDGNTNNGNNSGWLFSLPSTSFKQSVGTMRFTGGNLRVISQ